MRLAIGAVTAALSAAALSLSACTPEEDPVPSVLDGGEPGCAVLAPAALREMLPEGDYAEAGLGIRAPDSGDGPTTGKCAVDDALGRAAVSVTVEIADSSVTDGIRANDGWQTYTFAAEVGSGWAGHLGAETSAGYAVLGRGGVIAAVTVHHPRRRPGRG